MKTFQVFMEFVGSPYHHVSTSMHIPLSVDTTLTKKRSMYTELRCDFVRDLSVALKSCANDAGKTSRIILKSARQDPP